MSESPISDDLDEEEFNKILGQFRLQLNGIMWPLRLYGQGPYVDSAMIELENLALQLHMKLSGIDIPYIVDIPHW
jgi:hypothetical protein